MKDLYCYEAQAKISFDCQRGGLFRKPYHQIFNGYLVFDVHAANEKDAMIKAGQLAQEIAKKTIRHIPFVDKVFFEPLYNKTMVSLWDEHLQTIHKNTLYTHAFRISTPATEVVRLTLKYNWRSHPISTAYDTLTVEEYLYLTGEEKEK